MNLFSMLFLLTACHRNDAPETSASVQNVAVVPSSFSLKAINGDAFDSSLIENKVVLYVNVASKCGFTGQYDQLQKIHDKYKEQGFTVVGVPCNQFGGQEPGNAEEIVSFCKKNYGVDFPLLEKQDVNGKDQSPLYAALINSTAGKQKKIGWNFEKFLVDKNGTVLNRFSSMTKPNSDEITRAIEGALQ